MHKATAAVRGAWRHDAEAIARIYVDSWNAGFTGLMPSRELTAELVARWRQDLGRPAPHRWWVAEIEGDAAGFAGIGPSRDPIDPGLGELDTIAVDPSFWRAGVGTQLMAIAVEHLISDNYREAVLWTLAGYEPGQRFFEATGWVDDGATRDGARQVRYRHALGK